MSTLLSYDDYKRAIEDNFTIIDKNKNEVPFILNKAQQHFLQNLTERNVILKARKMGFSSVLLAVACVKFIYGRNERCYSMSFDATASSKQLDRAKHFLKSYERTTKREIPLKYNSKTELVWEGQYTDKNGELQSYTNALRVGTAKSTGFGRGDDITFLHLTEVSLADDIDGLLAGAGEAVVNGSIISLETTANGYNQFKTFWDEANSGARGYSPFFYDPTWEYSEEFVARKRKELGRLADQEYPLTPEAAFIASGDQYFDKIALQDLLKQIEFYDKERGYEVTTDQNHYRKYRDFKPGEFILVFADTAGGGR